SMVAHMEPPGPIGKGGWGFAYAVAKGGFDRIAGLLNVEYHDRGIVAYNVEPGFVAYGERLEAMLRRYSNIPVSAPAEASAAAALRADAAAHRRGQLEDGSVDAIVLGIEAEHIDVQVAVTEVTERDRARSGRDLTHARADHLFEIREAGERDGHVELVRDARG